MAITNPDRFAAPRSATLAFTSISRMIFSQFGKSEHAAPSRRTAKFERLQIRMIGIFQQLHQELVSCLKPHRAFS